MASARREYVKNAGAAFVVVSWTAARESGTALSATVELDAAASLGAFVVDEAGSAVEPVPMTACVYCPNQIVFPSFSILLTTDSVVVAVVVPLWPYLPLYRYYIHHFYMIHSRRFDID